MSHTYNQLFYDRVREMLEYWTGTPYADYLQQDLDMDDFDNLERHLLEAEAEASRQEFHNEFLTAEDTF